MKTNKSYAKRFKVTRKGKILSRKKGQNHFNAKERSRDKTGKGKPVEVKMKPKDRARFLHNI